MKKLLAMVLTVFTFALAGVFYGCGDPYKNAKIEVLTESSINLVINERGQSENAFVKVKISKMPKKASTKVVDMSIDKPNVASIVADSVDYNSNNGETSFEVRANGGGEATLVVKAEGGKSASVSIYVEQKLQNIHFNSNYTPAIIIGEDFIVDKNQILFEPATATNKNIKLFGLQTLTGSDLASMKFVNGVLSASLTKNLTPNTSYYLYAYSEDGEFFDRVRVMAVNRITENSIVIRNDNITQSAIENNKITLATNIAESSSKRFFVDVNGQTNLKYEFVENTTDNVYKVKQDSNDPRYFTISKQGKGISSLTIKVGYASSFDYYYVTKVIDVEVFEEPINIFVNGENSSPVDVNVFTNENDSWQEVDVQLEPSQTNFKEVKMYVLTADINLFDFCLFNGQDYEDLKFAFENEYQVATFTTNYKLQVKQKNANVDESTEVIFKSTRNLDVETRANFIVREQLQGFEIVTNKFGENASGIDVVSFEGEDAVLTIFAPVGSENVVEFNYARGYCDLNFVHGAKVQVTNVNQNINYGQGSFTLVGLAEGVSYLTIKNGSENIVEVRVVSANFANAGNNHFTIKADDNSSIINTEYSETQNFTLLNKLIFNNTLSEAVKISFIHSDLNVSLLFKSSKIENVNANNINFNFSTGLLSVENRYTEANAFLTLKMFYYQQTNEGENNFKLIQINNVINIKYSPELFENMLGFKRFNTGLDKEIFSAELVDYTTLSYNEALNASIIDLELYVKNNEYFNIESVTLENKDFLSVNGEDAENPNKYVFVKNLSDNNVFRFQILVGGRNTTSTDFVVLTFNVLQQGREEVIKKDFRISITKSKKVTSFVVDEDVFETDANGNFIMQLEEDYQQKTVKLLANSDQSETLNFGLFDVNIVNVDPTTLSPLPSGTLAISIANGVVTRLSEGVSKVTISLKNNMELKADLWAKGENNPYVVFDNLSFTFYVRCFGENVSQAIFNAQQLANISEKGNYIIYNNLVLEPGFLFNINSFKGTLDGNNFIIYGLNQNKALFNENFGTIKNLKILGVNQNVEKDSQSDVQAILVNYNFGKIDNVYVGGNVYVDQSFENNNLTFGAIVGENSIFSDELTNAYYSGQISNCNALLNAEIDNNASIVLGGVIGINYGYVSGDYQYVKLDENAYLQNPNIKVNVNILNNNSKVAVGGSIGVNYNQASNLKSEVYVNLNNNVSQVVAGGVLGVNFNGEIESVSGSLKSNNKLLSAACVVGKTLNYASINNAVGLLQSDNSFEATNAGGIVGEVVGYVQMNGVELNSINSNVTMLTGDNVGAVAGVAGQIEVDDVYVDKLKIVGTNKGSLVGKIAKNTILDDKFENYIFNVRLKSNSKLFEITTEPNANTQPVLDRNNNPLYVFVENNSGVEKQQLLFDTNRPIYNYLDENGEEFTTLRLAGEEVVIDYDAQAFEYSFESEIGSQLNAQIILGEQSQIIINNNTYNLNYYNYFDDEFSIYTYSVNNQINYVAIKQTNYVLFNDGTRIQVARNSFDNIVTVEENQNKGILKNTIVEGQSEVIYDEDGDDFEGTLNYNDIAIYSNSFYPRKSNLINVELKNVEVDGDNVSTYFGLNDNSILEHNVTLKQNQSVNRLSRISEDLEINTTPIFNAVTNENGIPLDSDLASKFVSTLGDGTNFISKVFEIGSQMKAMYLGVSSLNQGISLDLSKIIDNYSNYKVEVDSLSSSFAEVYFNNLIIKQAGVVKLKLSLYSNPSQIFELVINVASVEMPSVFDSLVYKNPISGVVNIPQGNNSFEFYVEGENVSVYKNGAVNGEKLEKDENNKYTLNLSKDESQAIVTVVSEAQFDNFVINGENVESKKITYFNENMFEVKVISRVLSISSTLNKIYVNKNDEVILTNKIVIDGILSFEEVNSMLFDENNFNLNATIVGGEQNLYPSINFNTKQINVSDVEFLNNKTYVTLTTFITFNDLNKQITSPVEFTISANFMGETLGGADINLTLAPQKINSFDCITKPLVGNGISEIEEQILVDNISAKILLNPTKFYNDETKISVKATLLENQQVVKFDKYLSLLNLSKEQNSSVLSQQIEVEKNNNLFEFFVKLKLNSLEVDVSSLKLKITISYNQNGFSTFENQTEFYFDIISPPVFEINFDKYYAVETNKEIVLTDSNEQNWVVNSEEFDRDFAGFEIVLDNNFVTGEAIKPTKNSPYILQVENTNIYYKISLVDNKYIFTTNDISNKFALYSYSNLTINGRTITLATSSVRSEVVKYTIDNISFTTNSGKQPLNKEIPIDFKIDYSACEKYKQLALEAINNYKAELLSGWWKNDRLVELVYNDETLLPLEPNQINTHDRNFIVVKRADSPERYAIWGLDTKSANISIQIKAHLSYVMDQNREAKVPVLLPYAADEQNYDFEIINNFNFSFYNFSTEENPTPIYDANQFITLLSSSNDGEEDVTTQAHFRLVNNIYLYNYTPIDANFDSLDGNGYAVYIGSFDLNAFNNQSEISLGLFTEIKQNSIVKNLSIAINGLNKFDANVTTKANETQLDLTNFNKVKFGLLTPTNNGYIANCEIVSFDLTKPITNSSTQTSASLEYSSINLRTATGAEVVFGTLVGENNGSIVNSRVGRSINSDYEYLGFELYNNQSSSNVKNGSKEYSRLINKNTLVQNGIDITVAGTVGGLVGINNENAIISSSYYAGGKIVNTETVVDKSFTGGLVALNYGKIALSDVEGRFKKAQKDGIESRTIRKELGIVSNGNVGGLVYLNQGEISDCYTNITISTNARSAAFVYNTEGGYVKNSYAFSTSETTTNNAPFVGLEPFETSYKGIIESSFYYKENLTSNFENIEASDMINNTNVLSRIPDLTFALTKSVYSTFAFSQSDENGLSYKNGVWEFDDQYGPILTGANTIAVSRYVLKRNELEDIYDINFPTGTVIDNINGYMEATNIDGVDNYILIKNAEEFNDRILKGEAEYQSKRGKKNVYRLISDITFGTAGDATSANEVIETSGLIFEGILDGNGLSINNLSITAEVANSSVDRTEDYFMPANRAVGMFAALANGASIKNLDVYVTQVTANNTDIVAGLVGILENSFVCNVNMLPYGDVSSNVNRISGFNIASGAIGLVIGDVENFKISNVTSSVSVTATSTELSNNSQTFDSSTVYSGFGILSESGEIVDATTNISLIDLKQTTTGVDLYGNPNLKYKYKGLSIASGVIGVTSVMLNENSSFNTLLENGEKADITLAQISRVKAMGADLRLTATNVGGVIGIVDENVYVHDIMFEVLAFNKDTVNEQKLGGTLTAGGISIVNRGLIKYARVEHQNQPALDEIYLSKDSGYDYTTNSYNNLFSLTPVENHNVYVGGITAINNVGEIVDSYVKVDVTPQIEINQNSYRLGLAVGLAIGGRIDYFYSLSNISTNITSGLIGEAKKAKVNEGNTNFDVNNLIESSVKNIDQVVLNTVSILVPSVDLSNTKFNALAGIGENDVFGNQATNEQNVDTTLININYTNANTNLFNSTSGNLYMLSQQEGQQSYNLVTTGGFSFADQLLTQSSITFAQFLQTLRWNVFTQNKMPYPFYGLSNSLRYITKESDFKELKNYPNATFIVLENANKTDGFDYVLDESILSDANFQFYGMLTGSLNENNETPKIKLQAPRFFGTLKNSVISNLDITVDMSNNTSELQGGIFANIATNTQFRNIKINISSNLSVKGNAGNDAKGFGFIAGLISGCNIDNCEVVGNVNNQSAVINVNNLNAVGGLVGRVENSSINTSKVTNIKFNISSVEANVDGILGGAVGVVKASSISTTLTTNVEVNSDSQKVFVGGFAGSVTGEQKSIISECYSYNNLKNSQAIKATNNNEATVAGFIVNVENVDISECFTNLNLTADNVSGFIYNVQQNSNVNKSYSTGDLQGKNVSGFITQLQGKVNYCYTTSKITINNNDSYNVSGFVSEVTNGTISNSFTLSEIEWKAGYDNSKEKCVRNFVVKNTKGKITNSYYSSELNYKYNLVNTNNTYQVNDKYVVNNISGEINEAQAKSFNEFVEMNLNFDNSNVFVGVKQKNNVYGFLHIQKLNITPNDQFVLTQQNNEMLNYKQVDALNNISDSKIIYIEKLNGITSNNNLENKILVGKSLENGFHANWNQNYAIFNSISNSIVSNLNISAYSKGRAVLANSVTNSILNQISINGQLTISENTAGAITGELLQQSLIVNSRNEAELKSNNCENIGGLVGSAVDSKIISSYNAGTIGGKVNLGGLVGVVNGNVRLFKSYNVGKVLGDFDEATTIGGLVGFAKLNSNLNIDNCYNTGLLKGNQRIAGLVYNEFTQEGCATINITSSYNTGAINASVNEIDDSDSTILFCYPISNYLTSSNNVFYNKDLFTDMFYLEVGIARSTTQLKTIHIDSDGNKISNYLEPSAHGFPLLKNVGGYVENQGFKGGQALGRGANLLKFEAKTFYAQGASENAKLNFIFENNVSGLGITAFNYTFEGTIYGCDYTLYDAYFPLIQTGENATISNVRVMGTSINNYNNPNAGSTGNLNATVADVFNGGFISNAVVSAELAALEKNGEGISGGIVGTLTNSTLTNSHVIETDIYQYLTVPATNTNTTTYYLGGLVGKVNNSNIRNSFYSGNIYLGRGFWAQNGVNYGSSTTGLFVGGIAGNSTRGRISNNELQNQVFYATEKTLFNDDCIDNEIVYQGTNKTESISYGDKTYDLYYNDITNNNYSCLIGNDLGASNDLREQNKNFTSRNNLELISYWMEKLDGIAGSSFKTPYLISSMDEFIKIKKDGYYKLTANITGKVENSKLSRAVIDKFPNLKPIENLGGSTGGSSTGGSLTEPQYLVATIENSIPTVNYFNGRGFIVDNLVANANSIFEDFSENTVLENVVFENIIVNAHYTQESNSTTSAIITPNNNGTIKGVGLIKCLLTVVNEQNNSTGGSDKAGYSTSVSDYWAGTVGGLAGTNNGEIDSCYSTSTISIEGASKGTVGGLVGYNANTIKNSYASGIIAVPFNPTNGNLDIIVGGAIGASANENVTVNGVYHNSDLASHFNSYVSTIGRTSIQLSTISFANFDNTQPKTLGISSQNAGLPKYKHHKNYKMYNTFAYNNLENSIRTIPNNQNIVEISTWQDFVEKLDAFTSTSIQPDSVFVLTNNIVFDKNYSKQTINFIANDLYFNGYSIFGYVNNQSLISQSACSFFNTCIVNPKIESEITKTSHSASVLVDAFDGDNETLSGIIMGGIISANYNNREALVVSTSSKNIIKVGIFSSNTSNLKIDEIYSTTSVLVKAADIVGQIYEERNYWNESNVLIKRYNETHCLREFYTEKKSKVLTINNFIGKTVDLGRIIVGNLILSNNQLQQNDNNNILVSIEEGSGTAGDIYLQDIYIDLRGPWGVLGKKVNYAKLGKIHVGDVKEVDIQIASHNKLYIHKEKQSIADTSRIKKILYFYDVNNDNKLVKFDSDDIDSIKISGEIHSGVVTDEELSNTKLITSGWQTVHIGGFGGSGGGGGGSGGAW